MRITREQLEGVCKAVEHRWTGNDDRLEGFLVDPQFGRLRDQSQCCAKVLMLCGKQEDLFQEFIGKSTEWRWRFDDSSRSSTRPGHGRSRDEEHMCSARSRPKGTLSSPPSCCNHQLEFEKGPLVTKPTPTKVFHSYSHDPLLPYPHLPIMSSRLITLLVAALAVTAQQNWFVLMDILPICPILLQ